MDLDEQSRQGHDAQRVWNEPSLKKARESVREAIMQRWASSPVADKEGQHELRLMLKLLDDLEGNLQRAIQDGKIADIEIERNSKEKFKRRIRGF